MMRLRAIKSTSAFVKSVIGDFTPKVGVILGSGLGSFGDAIEVVKVVDYSSIPDFPVSTVAGHSGRFIFGYVEGVAVVAMQGRFHYYEGYTMDQVTLPVRVMKMLGIEMLFISNAAGGVNRGFEVGDLMAITDHINLQPNPLIGKNIEELGTRFPDMHDCYDPQLIARADAIAAKQQVTLRHGVYVGLTGPTFETQAEYRFMEVIGGDAVGMSTVAEVIVARHMLIPVFAISVITNVGLSDEKGDHEDVQLQGQRASERLKVIFVELIKTLK